MDNNPSVKSFQHKSSHSYISLSTFFFFFYFKGILAKLTLKFKPSATTVLANKIKYLVLLYTKIISLTIPSTPDIAQKLIQPTMQCLHFVSQEAAIYLFCIYKLHTLLCHLNLKPPVVKQRIERSLNTDKKIRVLERAVTNAGWCYQPGKINDAPQQILPAWADTSPSSQSGWGCLPVLEGPWWE